MLLFFVNLEYIYNYGWNLLHVVFAVKNRANLIHAAWKNELYSYIAGIINSKNQKSIIVNGYTDHIHCFIGLRPSMAIADLVRDIKIIRQNL